MVKNGLFGNRFDGLVE